MVHSPSAVNVGIAQIVVLFLLVGGFGSIIEWRLGARVAIGLYWATAAAAAIFAGLVWHALHPLFADSAMSIFVAWESGYWIVKENFIPFFHFAGFFSGLGLMRWYVGRRAPRSRLDKGMT